MSRKDDLKKFLAEKQEAAKASRMQPQARPQVQPQAQPQMAPPINSFGLNTMPVQNPVPAVSSGQVDNVGMLPLNLEFINVDVEPIIIDDINDTTGRLSSRIESLEQKYGVGVLPYKATKIMPNVKRLQRHVILDLFGAKYISGIKGPSNKALLDDTLRNIQISLESGTSYISTINTTVTIDNVAYPTLKFNTYELSYIHKRFQHYNPQIKQTANGDVLLTVGNYE